MTKKIVALVLALCMVLGASAALAEKLTVNYWDDNFNGNALRAAAEDYKANVDPDFELELVLVSGSSDVENSMTTAGSSGDYSNLTDIVLSQNTGLGTSLGLPASFLDWNWLVLFPMFVIFFISALAETNRPPFDLVEAESELVAGHMIEYSSTPFLLFFLGEYVAITLMCALMTTLFLGGWLPPVDVWFLNWVPGIIWFMLKLCFCFFLFGTPAV